MSYLYLTSATGSVAIDIDRGIVVGPVKEHKGNDTRGISVKGSLSYILDSKTNLTQLGVDPAKMLGPAKSAKGKKAGIGRRPKMTSESAAPEE